MIQTKVNDYFHQRNNKVHAFDCLMAESNDKGYITVALTYIYESILR